VHCQGRGCGAAPVAVAEKANRSVCAQCRPDLPKGGCVASAHNHSLTRMARGRGRSAAQRRFRRLHAPNADHECDRSAGMHWSHPTQKTQLCGVSPMPTAAATPTTVSDVLVDEPGASARAAGALRGRVAADLPARCRLPCRRRSVASWRCVVRQDHPNADSTRRAWSSARPRAGTRQGPC
jgi:hypothetical protein